MKDVEREKAKELFGTAKEPSALASKVGQSPLPPSFTSPFFPASFACYLFETNTQPPTQIMGIKSRTFDIPSASLANGTVSSGDKSYRVKLTDKEKKRVEALIRGAKSLQEITRLEKELNEGRIPAGNGDKTEE